MTMADYESISIGSEWQVTQDLLWFAFAFVNAFAKIQKNKTKKLVTYFFSFGGKNCHILNNVFLLKNHQNFQFEFYFGEYFK
jgi:hypothetical protein